MNIEDLTLTIDSSNDKLEDVLLCEDGPLIREIIIKSGAWFGAPKTTIAAWLNAAVENKIPVIMDLPRKLIGSFPFAVLEDYPETTVNHIIEYNDVEFTAVMAPSIRVTFINRNNGETVVFNEFDNE